MAKILDIKVVAEKLIALGCDIAQGYYYAKPMPFDQYLLWVKDE